LPRSRREGEKKEFKEFEEFKEFKEFEEFKEFKVTRRAKLQEKGALMLFTGESCRASSKAAFLNSCNSLNSSNSFFYAG
jgi:hypothetical protein